MSKLKDYAELTRFNRPIGSFLLMWPTLWALWLAADGMPEWHLLIIFILGVFSMRSAGCVINDYADRKIDGSVDRTKIDLYHLVECQKKKPFYSFPHSVY